MEFDAIFLSRLQFAVTLGFHILFPTLTLGLAPFLVLLEALWLRTGKDVYVRLYRFWAKLFGLAFGMGVVTGVVLSFEFGTNFAPFSRATGNVLGPLLAYEVMTAFFLEAGFLPVMLLGWGRVGARLHFLATCMVALGTVLSAFWILAANSWMHTPAGFTLEAGIFSPADWWQVVFNPSFPYRLAHRLTARAHGVGSGFAARHPGLHSRRGDGPDAVRAGLHAAYLPAVPRQDLGRGLRLIPEAGRRVYSERGMRVSVVPVQEPRHSACRHALKINVGAR